MRQLCVVLLVFISCFATACKNNDIKSVEDSKAVESATKVKNEVATRPILTDIKSVNSNITYLGSYWTGETNEEGAIAEIVKFNPDNKMMYMVNGSLSSLDIVSLDVKDFNTLSLHKRVDVASLGAEHAFPSGDITSVDVNTKLKIIAIATQAENHMETGAIVFLDYDGTYISHFIAGVQPDMIGFSPDYKYVMTANEGEPRDGINDPAGSVTIVELANITTHAELKALDTAKVKTVGFTAFDSKRQDLINSKKVLLKPGVNPSTDLEPEYIAYAGDGKAYVSLQEANSVATFNLATKEFESVLGLGFKDHSNANNKIDLIDNNDEAQEQKTQANTLGVYMPDGLAAVTINAVPYVLTANEGDGRDDWYKDDLIETNINDAEEVEYLNPTQREGLDPKKFHLLGARSFSIWKASDMSLVFDSGSDFEEIVIANFPKFYNSDHAELDRDGRSDKKGPEPEDVKVAEINGKVFAFIGLERAGGLMIYDITKPANATFYDYINVRTDANNGALDNGSDLGPEGICIVAAKDSPTGKALALVANEVSGSVTVLELK